MTPYNVYKIYLSLKQHFSNDNSYDYFTYNGQVKATENSFKRRQDRFDFKKILRKIRTEKDLKSLFISNFVAGYLNEPVSYFSSQEAIEIYFRWIKGVQSLSYVIGQESRKIKQHLDEEGSNLKQALKVPEGGGHPILLRYFYAGEISLETIIIFLLIFNKMDEWEEKIKEDVLWPDTLHTIKKYYKFLEYDEKKVKSALHKAFFK